MIKEITVAGIKLNNYSSLENLIQVEKNMENKQFTIIEDVYMRTLLQAKEDEVVKEVIEYVDITEIADGEILDAVGANTIFRQKEIENREFFFQLLKRVERNGMTLFVVAESEKDAQNACEFLQEEFPRLKIEGYGIVDETVVTHEESINQMNMVAPDMILSVISSPAQEHFLYDHKGMISAKLWYGLGKGKITGKKHGFMASFWKKFRQKKLMKYIKSDKELPI